jgi:BMFP domain-containing protein YqiC
MDITIWLMVLAAAQTALLGYLVWMSQDSRDISVASFKTESETLLKDLSARFRQDVVGESERVRADVANSGRVLREELSGSFRSMSSQQIEQLEVMSRQWAVLHESNDKRVRELQTMVEQKLDRLLQNNSR